MSILQWGNSAGTTRYWMQVNTIQAFDGTDLVNSDLDNVSSRVVSGLSLGTKYCWRVKAGNDIAWGDWSAVQSLP